MFTKLRTNIYIVSLISDQIYYLYKCFTNIFLLKMTF